MAAEAVRPAVLPWEEFIDNECLIEEIRRRAPLYTRGANDAAKRRLWEEVCQLLFPASWHCLAPQHKTKTVRYVRQRWWNIRSSFLRELRAQQSVSSGQAPQKRRKHVYFDKLLFLLPTLEQEGAGSDPAGAGDDVLIIPQQEQPPSRQPEQKARAQPRAAGEQVAGAAAVADGELNFALSIVPMLQALAPERKLAAQIEILQVLQKFNCGHNKKM